MRTIIRVRVATKDSVAITPENTKDYEAGLFVKPGAICGMFGQDIAGRLPPEGKCMVLGVQFQGIEDVPAKKK